MMMMMMTHLKKDVLLGHIGEDEGDLSRVRGILEDLVEHLPNSGSRGVGLTCYSAKRLFTGDLSKLHTGSYYHFPMIAQVLSIAGKSAHSMTWCCIQKLCRNSGGGQYLDHGRDARAAGDHAQPLVHVRLVLNLGEGALDEDGLPHLPLVQVRAHVALGVAAHEDKVAREYNRSQPSRTLLNPLP
jgi:hypothetical protein